MGHKAYLEKDRPDVICCSRCNKERSIYAHVQGLDFVVSKKGSGEIWRGLRKACTILGCESPGREDLDLLGWKKKIEKQFPKLLKEFGFQLDEELSPLGTLQFDCPFDASQEEDELESTVSDVFQMAWNFMTHITKLLADKGILTPEETKQARRSFRTDEELDEVVDPKPNTQEPECML